MSATQLSGLEAACRHLCASQDRASRAGDFRLHRPLQKRPEGSRLVPRWHTLSRNEKIAVCGIGVTTILGVGAIATAIAVG